MNRFIQSIVRFLLLGGYLALATPASSQIATQDFFKVTFFSTKKQDMSQQEFIDYSIETHMPLVLQIPGIRGYVTNFAVPSAANPAFDAIVELWFDNPAAFQESLQSSAGQAAIADQTNFLATAPPYVVSKQRTLIYPNRPAEKQLSGATKTIYLINQHDVHSPETMQLIQFRDYAPLAIGALGPVFKGYQIDVVEQVNPDFPIGMIIHGWFSSKEALAARFQEEPALKKLTELQQAYYGKREIFDVFEYVGMTPPAY